MRPMSAINPGEVYAKPSTGTEFVVIDVNKQEKMVKVAMVPLRMDGSALNPEPVPFWVKSSSPIFIHDPVASV